MPKLIIDEEVTEADLLAAVEKSPVMEDEVEDKPVDLSELEKQVDVKVEDGATPDADIALESADEKPTEPNPEPQEEEVNVDANVLDFSKPLMIKDRDLELPVRTKEEALTLMHKGLNYTRKTQEMSQHKGTIEYMRQHGIDMNMLQKVAEVKAGNPDALNEMAKLGNIDLLKVDENAQYTPRQEFQPLKINHDVEMVAEEILSNQTLSQEFQSVAKNLPQDFMDILSTDANTLRNFAHDVSNGMAKELVPEALKISAITGQGFLQSYIMAANSVGQKPETPAAPQPNKVGQGSEQVPASKPNPNRSKATLSTPSGSNVQHTTDVWDMPDDEFLEYINSQTK